MGQQSNKIIKRRRRANYLKRKAELAKLGGLTSRKTAITKVSATGEKAEAKKAPAKKAPAKKAPAKKKAEEAPAPAAAAE